jgi:hypothetical protein
MTLATPQEINRSAYCSAGAGSAARSACASSMPRAAACSNLANLIDVSNPVIAGQLFSSRGEKRRPREL